MAGEQRSIEEICREIAVEQALLEEAVAGLRAAIRARRRPVLRVLAGMAAGIAVVAVGRLVRRARR